MKSFADWTDEIRALMNPPAPMADTCNFEQLRAEGIQAAKKCIDSRLWEPKLSAAELGTKVHAELEKYYECTPKGTIKWHDDDELLRRGIIKDPRDLRFFDPEAMERSAERYRKELLGEFKIGVDEGKPGGDVTAAAIAHRHDGRTVFSCGRRIGKSYLQNKWYKQAMDFLASQDYSKLEERVMAQVNLDTVLYGTGAVRWVWDDEATDLKVESLDWDIMLKDKP